jgi:methylenetetrahydrofolate dehydrogenase (NADP+)/methenyltetrahydrofolate cyclohydrolase
MAIQNSDNNKSNQRINGQKMADQLLQNYRQQIQVADIAPKLHIFLDSTNEISAKYVELKQTRAAVIGIDTLVHNITSRDTTDQIIDNIKELSADQDGIMVQLPLASHLDPRSITASIPPLNDVDQLNRTTEKHYHLQPVAGAVSIILDSIEMTLTDLITLGPESVHIVGQGFLVGEPVSNWFNSQGINPKTYLKGDDLSSLAQAKVIISGVGSKHIIRPEHIGNDQILIDCGTSTDSGDSFGDIHPECYDQARFYTPVPGGVGPLTLASLFANVMKLAVGRKGTRGPELSPIWYK